jgi:hypothetical protein
MDSLLAHPYFPHAVAFIVAVVLYQQVARLFRRGPGGAVTGNLARDVRRYKGEGNFLAAGKLLEDAGKLQEAVATYLEGYSGRWTMTGTAARLTTWWATDRAPIVRALQCGLCATTKRLAWRPRSAKASAVTPDGISPVTDRAGCSASARDTAAASSRSAAAG